MKIFSVFLLIIRFLEIQNPYYSFITLEDVQSTLIICKCRKCIFLENILMLYGILYSNKICRFVVVEGNFWELIKFLSKNNCWLMIKYVNQWGNNTKHLTRSRPKLQENTTKNIESKRILDSTNSRAPSKNDWTPNINIFPRSLYPIELATIFLKSSHTKKLIVANSMM
jgi:hypothetical protein